MKRLSLEPRRGRGIDGPVAEQARHGRQGSEQRALALRERRAEEARGVVHPQPTPEERVEMEVLGERFARWVGGDDSAGPFE